MATVTEHELVVQAALDYFEGWYAGDVARMDRALHPDLVKRWAGDQQGIALGTVRTRAARTAATSRSRSTWQTSTKRSPVWWSAARSTASTCTWFGRRRGGGS